MFGQTGRDSSASSDETVKKQTISLHYTNKFFIGQNLLRFSLFVIYLKIQKDPTRKQRERKNNFQVPKGKGTSLALNVLRQGLKNSAPLSTFVVYSRRPSIAPHLQTKKVNGTSYKLIINQVKYILTLKVSKMNFLRTISIHQE